MKVIKLIQDCNDPDTVEMYNSCERCNPDEIKNGVVCTTTYNNNLCLGPACGSCEYSDDICKKSEKEIVLNKVNFEKNKCQGGWKSNWENLNVKTCKKNNNNIIIIIIIVLICSVFLIFIIYFIISKRYNTNY